MTRYKQYATTAYSGLDFSILNVHPPSPPILEPLNASTYLAIWTKILQSPPLSPSTISTPADDPNNAMTSALTFAITWLLRLYDDVYPDDAHTPLAHLRNFLAIPQQFMVTCLQFANYSVPAAGLGHDAFGGRFALPVDMETVAVRGVSTTRLLAVGWVVWLYLASAGVVVVGVGGVVLAMVMRREGLPGSTGFVEVDLAARFQSLGALRGEEGDGLAVMREVGRARAVRTAVSSSFGVAKELRRRRIRVVSVSAAEGRGDGENELRGYKLFAFREGDENNRGNEGRLARMDSEETRGQGLRVL